MLASEEAGLDAASLRMRSATDLALRTTIATAQVVLEHYLWLTMMEMKETDLVPFLDASVLSGSLLDQLWRALLNASQRLTSRLKRCNTSSLNAPALLLLPVAPNLCLLSRQPNQRQPPRSPDLLRVCEIEGSQAQ